MTKPPIELFPLFSEEELKIFSEGHTAKNHWLSSREEWFLILAVEAVHQGCIVLCHLIPNKYLIQLNIVICHLIKHCH